MKTIWKHDLRLEEIGEAIRVPEGSQVLCIKEQYGIPCLWLLVDDELPLSCTITAYGTGHTIPYTSGTYIDTIIYLKGELVFHFFIR